MHTDTKSLFWKVVAFSYYAFFALFPFFYSTSFLYGGTATRSLALIIFAALVGITIAASLYTKRATLTLLISPLLAALTAYFAAITVSGFLGIEWSTSFWSVATRMTGLWYFLSLGIFMLILMPLAFERRFFNNLILVIALSSALYSVLDLVSDGFGWFSLTNVTEAFTFGNTTFAAMYLFGAFLLAIYYLLQSEEKRWWMYALPVVLVINPNFINAHVWFGDFSQGIVGNARASTIALLLAIVLLIGIWAISKIRDARRRAQVSFALFGLGLVIAACAALSLLTQGGYLREAYLQEASAARPLVWGIAAQAIAERPVFGWGGDNFERAFEQHYDNRLLQGTYGGEAWFDRAHNVFFDQAVDNGLIGTALYVLVYIVTIFGLVYAALYAEEKRDRLLAAVLVVYFTLHIAELQTAFDTSISYPILALMFVAATILVHRTLSRRYAGLVVEVPEWGTYACATVLGAFCIWSLFFGALPLWRAEQANGEIRSIGSSEKRLPLYAALFATPVDKQAFLWRIETDFERGIGENPAVLNDPKKFAGLKEEMAVFEREYRDYVEAHPDNFRAHLSFANVLIYERLFDVNKLQEAQQVLDRAIALAPQAPQPYWMKAVGYVYMHKFDLAREFARKGVALNPKITQSEDVMQYVNNSIRTFPEIDLYFFRKI